MKYVFQGIGAVVLASAAWHFLGGDSFQSWLSPKPKSTPVVKFQNDGPSTGLPASAVSSAPKNIPMAAGGARKCRGKGGTVFYTDRECPAGAKEQDIQGGSITVVKGSPVKSDKGPVNNPLPNAREMLGANEPTLADKRVERAMSH